ncbi:hypothetical protein EGT51_09235 [Levilactobacillus suantsaiihabitans]|uniref:Uncharacterized protein n=1 Tax=Levilactobacillus suantsaiihabitans TaxID=2487722 RepID=A0A4Z0J8E1_9LACO|nr:hypothetical protein EGT51_09235 [Levilactobacillus suantsaiihabitans]
MGGPVEPKSGLALALSRRARLKDASSLSAMNRAAKGTPTAELIWDGLSARLVIDGNVCEVVAVRQSWLPAAGLNEIDVAV